MNPLATLYGSATALRNTLFDRQVLKARFLRRPVISVGNLSVGGTGKTPFVIALGELLKQRNVTFDILSRGYGRKSRGALIVDPDGNASQFGDEPLLIARQLDAPVVVGESRFAAGELAEQSFRSQAHILDDGFQHRSLARNYDIVILSESDFADDLLPLGRLREPLSSLRRADAVVLPESSSVSLRGNATFQQLVRPPLVCHITRELTLPIAPLKPIVFCGIARPQQFFDQIRGAGIVPAAEVNFRDHHLYTAKDVGSLLTIQKEKKADAFLTTAKDAINLEQFQHSLEPLVIASLKMTLARPNDLVDAIMARIPQAGLRT